MGFYIRKSISVGPLRFNLSKSGVGVSAGIKGFRVGSGPRGNYVHMGRHGVYYRQSLPSNNRAQSQPARTGPADPGHGPMQQIESAHVSEMRDSSSEALLHEFARKKKKWRISPAVAVVVVLGALALVVAELIWLAAIVVVLAIPLVIAAHLWDVMRKTVVLFYDFDREMQRAFESLHESFNHLRKAHATWNVHATADVYDRKRNAGASAVIERKAIRLSCDAPPFVKTNIPVPKIPAGRETLYLFPDRILVFTSSGVGAVAFRDLRVDRSQTRFIEDGHVPRDAQVVDHTWRYVNKDGSPDRRFNDNRQLPIALYEELNLTSGSGLNEVFQYSKVDIAEQFERALSGMV